MIEITSHSKETKKYMITLHIPHILELSEEKDDKLLDLVVPSISWHWISWNQLLTHWMLTPATLLWKVAGKWNDQMENMNTPSYSWHLIVQNWHKVCPIWTLEKNFSVSECIKLYMHFNQNFVGSAIVCSYSPFEQRFRIFPSEYDDQESWENLSYSLEAKIHRC